MMEEQIETMTAQIDGISEKEKKIVELRSELNSLNKVTYSSTNVAMV